MVILSSLVFYDVEERLFRGSYRVFLDREEVLGWHAWFCRRFNLRVGLVFDDRTFGYYDIDLDAVGVPSVVSLGVLLHEFGHVLEHKRFGFTSHRERLFQVIHDLNMAAGVSV